MVTLAASLLSSKRVHVLYQRSQSSVQGLAWRGYPVSFVEKESDRFQRGEPAASSTAVEGIQKRRSVCSHAQLVELDESHRVRGAAAGEAQAHVAHECSRTLP